MCVQEKWFILTTHCQYVPQFCGERFDGRMLCSDLVVAVMVDVISYVMFYVVIEITNDNDVVYS